MVSASNSDSSPPKAAASARRNEKAYMNYWIRAYNNRQYRVVNFIRDNGFIDWGMRNHLEKGDIVFLYATAPASRITFAMEVAKTSMTWKETAEDSAYFLSQAHYDHWLASRETKPYVRFSLLRELHSPYLTFHNLMQHGLGGAPRSPRRLQPEVVDYILAHFD